MQIVTKKMPILKLDKSDERKEIDFELDFLTCLSRKERFEMMLRKTREIRDLLENSGHREDLKYLLKLRERQKKSGEGRGQGGTL